MYIGNPEPASRDSLAIIVSMSMPVDTIVSGLNQGYPRRQ